TYPPEVNGVALTVQSLEHGLRDRGHVVTLVRPRQDADASTASDTLVRGVALPRYPGLRAGLPATRRLLDASSDARPVAGYRASATSGDAGAWPVYRGRTAAPPATRRLLDAGSDSRPDAVAIATEGPLGWSALRAARRLGIPAATGFHTRFDAYMRDYRMPWL